MPTTTIPKKKPTVPKKEKIVRKTSVQPKADTKKIHAITKKKPPLPNANDKVLKKTTLKEGGGWRRGWRDPDEMAQNKRKMYNENYGAHNFHTNKTVERTEKNGNKIKYYIVKHKTNNSEGIVKKDLFDYFLKRKDHEPAELENFHRQIKTGINKTRAYKEFEKKERDKDILDRFINNKGSEASMQSPKQKVLDTKQYSMGAQQQQPGTQTPAGMGHLRAQSDPLYATLPVRQHVRQPVGQSMYVPPHQQPGIQQPHQQQQPGIEPDNVYFNDEYLDNILYRTQDTHN